MAEYVDLYQRIIAKQSFGFKLALGGTGIGKTRGIRELIKANRSAGLKQKIVYCANRVQLLDAMYDELTVKDGFSDEAIIHLERNRDTVVNAITGKYRENFYKLLREPNVLQYAQKSHVDRIVLERTCHQIEQLAPLMKDPRQGFSITELVRENVEALSRDVLDFFKKIMRVASDTDRTALLHHPVIQTLFPYIAFKHNPQARVLLLTIQKAFFGFFDGSANINMNQLKDCIVFLDEFDFLEADLTQMICESPQIEDPFLFVEMFYRAMKRHKLPLDNYPIDIRYQDKVARIREQITEIVQQIDELKITEGIPYPEINQFTTKMKEKRAAIFRTNRTIIRHPLYLQETSRSFEIISDSPLANTPAVKLFNEVSRATSKILHLFKEIETVDPTIYDEMLFHCFPQSLLADHVRQITQLPRMHRDQFTRFDSLLDSGFGLYEIEDLQQVTDPEEVKFRHYAIHTTPEKVLLSLAQKNLVFGLSATADLSRFVKHFDDHWLRKQLNSTEDTAYFEVEEADKDIIQELNERKQARRETELRVYRQQDLEMFSGGKDIKAYIKQVADNFADGFGVDDPNGYRRSRVERFFAALLEISQTTTSPEGNTHLLFYVTFTQILYIFRTAACHRADLFQVEQIFKDMDFPAYRLRFAGQSFNVIFYDASKAKLIHQSEEIKKRYQELFWDGVAVLLVTQYASAGNGVNLQYRPSLDVAADIETDFRNIHLMEGPFYYFDDINPQKQTSQEISTSIKKNIWYLAKLYEAKVISSDRFFGALENIRNDHPNGEYRSGKNVELQIDSLKNRIATYIQALGRVERVWDKVPAQTIFLSEDVFDDFARFVQDDDFSHIHQQRFELLSNNLARMMEQIDVLANDRRRIARRYTDDRLAAQDNRCQEYVHELLRRLHAMRRGSGDEDAKREWTALRVAALEHSFANQVLAKSGAVFKSAYLSEGNLYIDKDKRLYPHDKRTYESYAWRLDSAYDVINRNPTIANYFRARGFELTFDGINDQFFVPYFYQAILVGAIGEAAIKATLREAKVDVDDDLPTQLFELADLKIVDSPLYIDCKNYSERTLSQFHYSQNDPAYRQKLNESDFKASAKAKLQHIQAFHYEDPEACKLIYLNLVGSEERLNAYFDNEFREVESFDQAQIIIVQGILRSENPAEYNKSFIRFLHDLKRCLGDLHG